MVMKTPIQRNFVLRLDQLEFFFFFFAPGKGAKYGLVWADWFVFRPLAHAGGCGEKKNICKKKKNIQLKKMINISKISSPSYGIGHG